ncbi:uncharacterized protein J3R85_006039 [Psidium guajava]|nr:uncharacterized protein J3R85_006039 [Psidium guajava]
MSKSRRSSTYEARHSGLHANTRRVTTDDAYSLDILTTHCVFMVLEFPDRRTRTRRGRGRHGKSTDRSALGALSRQRRRVGKMTKQSPAAKA